MRSVYRDDRASYSVAALTAKYTPREIVPAVVAPTPIDLDAIPTMQKAALIRMTVSHVKGAIIARLLQDAQDRPSLADYGALVRDGLAVFPPGKRFHEFTDAGRFLAVELQHKLCIEFDIHLLAEGADGIDDCNAVGDFPEVFELCLKSPVGQCQYEAADGFRRCIHCRKGDGVL